MPRSRATGGGAKVSDLVKLGRYVERYIQAHGELPSARWYLVNHFAGIDPAGRQVILAGADDDVALLADGAGLAWSTTDLFTVVMAVRSGRATTEQARRFLRCATGRLNLPPEWKLDSRPPDTNTPTP